MMSVVPFFVADRPMSLRIIKGLPLSEYSGARIGIMAHANTSLNFQHLLNDYPCDDKNYCDAVKGPCRHPENTDDCPVKGYILANTIKMCDSGIFTREGATLTYEELFEAYYRMGVDFGIMIDVFRNPQATLDSAREAIKVYASFKEKKLAHESPKKIFDLVGVAQGKSIEEYISNYEELRAVGISHIAVGGLLRKVEKTVRYTQVRDEDFMYQVLHILRDKYPEDWLFALGCFSPGRLDQFKKINVWGDYKGWIFQYEKRNDTLDDHLDAFVTVFSEKDTERDNEDILALKQIISTRKHMKEQQKELFHQLNVGRGELKAILRSLYAELQTHFPEMARQLEPWLTRSILDGKGEKLVCSVLGQLNKDNTAQTEVLKNIHQNREIKKRVEYYETQLNAINAELIQQITEFKRKDLLSSPNLQRLSIIIEELIGETEQKYRFEQVKSKIEQNILMPLQISVQGNIIISS